MKEQAEKNKVIASRKGRVVSDAMHKTVVVAVDSFKTHSKYKKKYRVTRRYKAHDEENTRKIGDVVKIVPCRPMSKGKRFKVV